MAIVRTDIPTTSALCNQEIQEITRTYPFCRSEQLTTTAFGRDIRTLVVGNGSRHVLFCAAHHANEWITTPVLLKFAEELAGAIASGGDLAGQNAQELAARTTIYMVPMVNPDGVDLVTGAIAPGQPEYESARLLAQRYPGIPFPEGWKANLMGVDLNLNYPAGWLQAREIKFSQGYIMPGPRDYVGRAPLNQVETRVMAGYTEAIDPALILTYHTQGQVIYWQFRNYEVPGARELGERLAAASGYTLEETPYESSFAGYKDWFIQNYLRPGYTIEAGLGENPLPLSQFDQIYRNNLGLLMEAAKG